MVEPFAAVDVIKAKRDKHVLTPAQIADQFWTQSLGVEPTDDERLVLHSALDDADALAIVRKEVKKRQDSIEAFEKGGRPEMAATEKAEIEILNNYLPQPLSAEEVTTLVQAAIAEAGATSRKEMGAVMKIVNEKAGGRADGRTISAEVQKHLPA